METIYLLELDEDGNPEEGEITWCEDDALGNGTPYILKSKFKELEAENKLLKEQVTYLSEWQDEVVKKELKSLESIFPKPKEQ